jgi:hypothetical protein
VSAIDAAGNTSPAKHACTTVPFSWSHFPTLNLERKPSPPPALQLDNAKPMTKVSDAKSWQGKYLTGPVGSGVFLDADCCSHSGWDFSASFPFFVTQINRASVLVTTCAHCGKLRVGSSYDSTQRRFIGKTHDINLHSKRTHRGKIVTVQVKAPASSLDKQVVVFQVLSGKPRIEGIAGMPSAATISAALD